MRKSKGGRKWTKATPCLAALFMLLIVSLAIASAEDADKESEMPIKIEIRNRLYPKFFESHETTMNKREYVGDTDFSYEVVEFFPHFAIIDSTKEAVTLSEEAKNAAFRITVYEKDEVIETAWAFYHIDVPHFQRTSYLFFKVVEFEYRGEVFSKEEKESE